MTAAQPPLDGAEPRLRRVWIPVVAALLVATILVTMWSLPAELFERGAPMSVTILSTAALVAIALAWFFFWSGVSRQARYLGLAVVMAAGGALAGSVRRIEFSGDMVPTVEFRWRPDRADVLEQHRAHQRAGASSGSSAAGEISISELDMPEYRGRARDGVVRGPALARDWTTRPPKLVWRQPVGGGYASFAVVGPLAITIEQRRDREAIVAYDVNSGREQWIHDYPALFSERLGGDGPRATPTVDGQRVYSLGGTGELVSLDLATGNRNWATNLFGLNGAKNLPWGMCGSPLVYDNMILVNPGSQDGTQASRAVLALDANTGKLLWGAGQTKASYSSPMLATLAGQRQILIFDAVGLAGLDPHRGEELWRYPWTSDYDVNAAQPVIVSDDEVFISSATGAALLKIAKGEAWSVDPVWKTINRNMKCSYACPIARDGFMYGLDEGILVCLDLADGKRRWKGGRYGHGQMLRSDDLLVVLAESGELILVEATPDALRELGRIQAIDGKTWNNPAMAGRRVFVRNHLEMAAYDLPLLDSTPPSAGAVPAPE